MWQRTKFKDFKMLIWAISLLLFFVGNDAQEYTFEEVNKCENGQGCVRTSVTVTSDDDIYEKVSGMIEQYRKQYGGDKFHINVGEGLDKNDKGLCVNHYDLESCPPLCSAVVLEPFEYRTDTWCVRDDVCMCEDKTLKLMNGVDEALNKCLYPVARNCRSICDRFKSRANNLNNIPNKYFSCNGTIAVIGIPPNYTTSTTVYCDCNTKPKNHLLPHTYGAIVIQRRENGKEMYNGSVDPNYTRLTGDLRSDHWLGLETVHLLTEGNASAQIEFVKNGSDGKLKYSFIRYRQFYVSSSTHKYAVWAELKTDENYSSRTENNFDGNSKLPEFMYKDGSGWWFDGSNTNLNAMDAIHWGNSTYDAVQIKILPGGAVEKTNGCRFNLCNNLDPATSRKFCISNKCKCVGPIVTKDGELDWEKKCRIPFTKTSTCTAICDDLSDADVGRNYSTRETPAYLKFGSEYEEVLCDCVHPDYGYITMLKRNNTDRDNDFSTETFGSPESGSFWIGAKSMARIVGVNSKIKLLFSHDTHSYSVIFRELELSCSEKKITLRNNFPTNLASGTIHTIGFKWEMIIKNLSTSTSATLTIPSEQLKLLEMKVLADNVCWNEYESTNAIHGLVRDGVVEASKTFYLGTFDDDNARGCAEACANTTGCIWWTLHLQKFNANWTKKCYGRSNYINKMVPEANIVSGQMTSCKDCTKNISELYSDLDACPVQCSKIKFGTEPRWCVNSGCSCNCGVMKSKLYGNCEQCLVPVVQTKSCIDICDKWSKIGKKSTNGTVGYMKLYNRYAKVYCDCSCESTGDQCNTSGWMTIYRKNTDQCGNSASQWMEGYGNIERGDFWIGKNTLDEIGYQSSNAEVILSRNGTKFYIRYDESELRALWKAQLEHIIETDPTISPTLQPNKLDFLFLQGWYDATFEKCNNCSSCPGNLLNYKVEEIKVMTNHIQPCSESISDLPITMDNCPIQCFSKNMSSGWCLSSHCKCENLTVTSKQYANCGQCLVPVVQIQSCADICRKWSKIKYKSTSGTVGYILQSERFVSCDCSNETIEDRCNTYGWMTIYRKSTEECNGDWNSKWTSGYGNAEDGNYWIGEKNIFSQWINNYTEAEIILSGNGTRFFVRYGEIKIDPSGGILQQKKYSNFTLPLELFNFTNLKGWYPYTKSWRQCGERCCLKKKDSFRLEEIKIVTISSEVCQKRLLDYVNYTFQDCPPKCSDVYPNDTNTRWCLKESCECTCGGVTSKADNCDNCLIPLMQTSSCTIICENLTPGTATGETLAYLDFGSKYQEVLCDCTPVNLDNSEYKSTIVMKHGAYWNESLFSEGFGLQNGSFWIGLNGLARVLGENDMVKLTFMKASAGTSHITFRKFEINFSQDTLKLFKSNGLALNIQTIEISGSEFKVSIDNKTTSSLYWWNAINIIGENYTLTEMKVLEDNVCWDKYGNTNVVYDLLSGKPEDKGTNYFYFGKYEDDEAHKCAEACAKTSNCSWWALHLSNFCDSNTAKTCYGRTNYKNKMVPEQNVLSGKMISCTDCTKEVSELHSSLTKCPVKCSDIESTNKTKEEWCVNDRCSCNYGVIKSKLYGDCEHCLVPVVQTKSCVDICKKWSETKHNHTSGTTGYMKLDDRYVKVYCDCSNESTKDQCITYGWMTIYRKVTDECGWGHNDTVWSTGYGNIERGDFWIGTDIISNIVDENADTEVILSKNATKYLLRYDKWSSTELMNVKYKDLSLAPENLRIEYLIGWYHEGLGACEKSECDTCPKNSGIYKVEEIKIITDQIQGCEKRMVDTGYPVNKPCPSRCSDVYPNNTSAKWCLRSGCDCSCGGVSSRISYGCKYCIVRVEKNCDTVYDYSEELLLKSGISSAKKFKPVYLRSAQKIVLCHKNNRGKNVSEPFAASCPEICKQIERNSTLNKPLSPSETGAVSSILIEDWFVEAYCECDKTDTHDLAPTTGWIVFQRRIDQKLFAGGDYEKGFGNPSEPESYWLGVKAIRMLASRNKPAKLQINLKTENNDTYFIRYNKFSLSNDNKLIVEDPGVIAKNGSDLTTAYEFNRINKSMWTVEQEIDFTIGTKSCGDTSTMSVTCSLNGAYSEEKGVQWYNPNGNEILHYKFVEMKICPQDWDC